MNTFQSEIHMDPIRIPGILIQILSIRDTPSIYVSGGDVSFVSLKVSQFDFEMP